MDTLIIFMCIKDVRKKVSPLLKAFQSEVDSLTKRGNMGETVFLNLYKKLVEIPGEIYGYIYTV